MLNAALVEEQQDQIRRQIREMPDDLRRTYYKLAEKKIKDPDTYAALNYIFIAGLHHFYLGKWSLGIINIVVFWGGVACILLKFIEVGIALIIGIILFELFELFRSQILVQHHNNLISQEIISTLGQSG